MTLLPLLTGSVAGVILSLHYHSISVLISYLVLSGLICLQLRKNSRNMKLIAAIVILMHVGIMIWVYYANQLQYGAPYYIGGSDDLEFERLAEHFYSMGKYYSYQISDIDFWTATNGRATFANARGYVLFLINIKRFSSLFDGYHTVIPRAINLFALLSIAIMMSDPVHINEKKTSTKLSRPLVFILIALFPNSVYIFAHVFRDALGVFFLIVCYVFLSRQSASNKHMTKIINVALACGAAVASGYFRTENLAYSVLMILLFLPFSRVANSIDKLGIVRLIALIISVFTLIYAMAWPYVNDFIVRRVVSRITLYTEYLSDINPGLSRTVFEMPLLPFGIILRIMLGLVSPLPVWVLHSIRDGFKPIDFIQLYIAIGTALQVIMLPFVFIKNKYFVRDKILFWSYIVSIVLLTFTFRHFILVYPFYLRVVLANYSSISKKKKNKMLILGFALLFSLMASYILVKYVYL